MEKRKKQKTFEELTKEKRKIIQKILATPNDYDHRHEQEVLRMELVKLDMEIEHLVCQLEKRK